MENMKTFEEFNLFGKKKELTADEEYQKQKKIAEREQKRVMKNTHKDVDPYGEEEWDPKKDARQARKSARMSKRYVK